MSDVCGAKATLMRSMFSSPCTFKECAGSPVGRDSREGRYWIVLWVNVRTRTAHCGQMWCSLWNKGVHLRAQTTTKRPRLLYLRCQGVCNQTVRVKSQIKWRRGKPGQTTCSAGFVVWEKQTEVPLFRGEQGQAQNSPEDKVRYTLPNLNLNRVRCKSGPQRGFWLVVCTCLESAAGFG